MKRLLLFPSLILFTFLLATPTTAQLATADIKNSIEKKLSGKTWDAMCGESRVECKVSFDNGRLSVDKSLGITPEDVISIDIFRWCRKRYFGTGQCTITTADKDVTIKYQGNNGEIQFALISLVQWEAAAGFYSDLNFWSQGKAPIWIPGDPYTWGKRR